MRKNKRVYWVVTSFISLFMLFSAYYSFMHEGDFKVLGFPNYFRIELCIAKVIGAILLLIPAVSLRVKEWIYAGFGISMLSAIIGHAINGDPVSKIISVIIDFILFAICVQYIYLQNQAFDTREEIE